MSAAGQRHAGQRVVQHLQLHVALRHVELPHAFGLVPGHLDGGRQRLQVAHEGDVDAAKFVLIGAQVLGKHVALGGLVILEAHFGIAPSQVVRVGVEIDVRYG